MKKKIRDLRGIAMDIEVIVDYLEFGLSGHDYTTVADFVSTYGRLGEVLDDVLGAVLNEHGDEKIKCINPECDEED